MRRGPVLTAELGWDPTFDSIVTVLAAPGAGYRYVVTQAEFSLGDTVETRIYVTSAAPGTPRHCAFWTGGRNMHNHVLLRSGERSWTFPDNDTVSVHSSLAASHARISLRYYIEEIL